MRRNIKGRHDKVEKTVPQKSREKQGLAKQYEHVSEDDNNQNDTSRLYSASFNECLKGVEKYMIQIRNVTIMLWLG